MQMFKLLGFSFFPALIAIVPRWEHEQPLKQGLFYYFCSARPQSPCSLNTNMDGSKILDWNVLNALGLYPETGEEIVWVGQPAIEPSFPGALYVLFEDSTPWIAYYVAQAFIFIYGLESSKFWLFSLNILTFLVFQLLPFVNQYQKTKRSVYVVTNKRIVLHIWRNFVGKTHILRFDDFQKTLPVEDETDPNNGTVYLMTGKDVGFWTYKIESDERSQHPSIESIRNASEVGRQIEQLRLQSAMKK